MSTLADSMQNKVRMAEDDRGGLVVGSFDLDRLVTHRPGLAEIAATLGLSRKFMLLTGVLQGAIESEVASLVGARAKLSDRRILNIHPRRISLCGLVRGAIDVDETGVRLSFLVHQARPDCAHGTSPFITVGASAVLRSVERLPSAIGEQPRLKEVLADILGVADPDVAVTICGLAAATLSSKAAIAAVLYEALVLLKDKLPRETVIALAQASVLMLRAPSPAALAKDSLGTEIYARAGALVKAADTGARQS